MASNKVRVVVAVSGGGRSLKNLLEKQKETENNYEIVGVVSSKADCGGVSIAEEAHLPVFVGNFKPVHAKKTSKELTKWLEPLKPKWIALAGFLAPFPLEHSLSDHVINIHPALLPKFGGKGMYGMHVHRAVVAAKEVYSGATIHKVTKEYDEGRVLARVRVEVKDSTPEELAARVFTAECDLYPRVLRKLCALGDKGLEDFAVMQYDYPS